MKIKTTVRKLKELSPEQRAAEARLAEALYQLAKTRKPTVKKLEVTVLT